MTTAVKRENGFIAQPLKAPSAVKKHIHTDLANHARIKERETVLIHGRTEHMVATATMYCGQCDRAAALHPIRLSPMFSRYEPDCNRELESFPYVSDDIHGDRSDYILWPTGDVTIPTKHWFDTSGEKFADPDEYVSADVELDALSRYYDKNPAEVTLTLEEHQTLYGQDNYVPTVMRSYFDPEQRNAYVDATDGFVIAKFMDDLLTRKYQNHLINAFVDKRTGKPRVGSVELVIDKIAQVLNARCVSCNAAFTVDLDTTDRDKQERTAWAIISHGNNHAAKFIRERDTFYLLPGTLSDKHSITVPEELNSREAIEFLFDHQQYCKDSRCQCESWLAYLTPALAV